MAVHKRSYVRYQGELTSEGLRFSVLTRYALKTAFSTRFTTPVFTLCFVPHLIALTLIYLRNNLKALVALAPGVPVAQLMNFFPIDGAFFSTLLAVEAILTFGLVSVIGPGLVSPDLANNALPLYLSRPFSRAEYVAGKLAALLALTSLVTWVPGGLLIGVQTSLAGFAWLSENKGVALAVIAGSWLWILTVSLVALAVSAWVRWRTVAIPALFGVFFVAGSFGAIANGLLRLDPPVGSLIQLLTAMRIVWDWFALGQTEYFGYRGVHGLPAWTALVSLLGFCAASVGLLAWKVRPSEVVR